MLHIWLELLLLFFQTNKIPPNQILKPPNLPFFSLPSDFICWVVKSAFPSPLGLYAEQGEKPRGEGSCCQMCWLWLLPGLHPLACCSHHTIWATAQASKGGLSSNKLQLCSKCKGSVFWSDGISSKSHLCLPAFFLAVPPGTSSLSSSQQASGGKGTLGDC